jgi:hypothetical protein
MSDLGIPEITTITVRRSAYEAAQALAGANGIDNLTSIERTQDLRDSCWANSNHEAAKFWQEVNEIALASLVPELYNIVIIGP